MAITLNISRFSSLIFSKSFRAPFEKEVDNIQLFSVFDEIRIQYSIKGEQLYPIRPIIIDFETGEKTDLAFIEIDKETSLYQIHLNDLEQGNFRIAFVQRITASFDNTMTYADICVTNEIPENSILLRYTNRRNEFDTKFIINGEQLYFEYRVIGGFLSNAIKYKSDNNTFRDQRNVQRQLSQFPSYIETLTIGDGIGVTKWAGEKLNLIFSCSEIFINDVQYVRSESSAPEIMQLGDYHPLFVFRIDLEPVEFYLDQFNDEIPWVFKKTRWYNPGIWLPDREWK